MKERLDALFAHFTSRSPTYLNTLPSLKTRAQLLKFSLLPLHLYLTRYDSSLQSKLFYGFLFLFETRSMRLFLFFIRSSFSLLWVEAILKIRSSRKIFYFNKIRRGEKIHVSILNIYSTFPSNSTHFVPQPLPSSRLLSPKPSFETEPRYKPSLETQQFSREFSSRNFREILDIFKAKENRNKTVSTQLLFENV